jgi:hypothetical protein
MTSVKASFSSYRGLFPAAHLSGTTKLATRAA